MGCNFNIEKNVNSNTSILANIGVIYVSLYNKKTFYNENNTP